MTLRGRLTVTRLAKLGGSDKKTIRKVLDGRPIRNQDALQRIADGLSYVAGHARVTSRDFPQN